MLFAISLLLFVIYTGILLKDKSKRWVGWILFAVYFGVLILFGDLLRSIFNMEEGSKTFFMFIACVFTLVPLFIAEAVGAIFGKKSA